MVAQKKEHRLSAGEKCVELTETLTVEKKAEKVRKIGTRITLRNSRSNGIFRQNDGNNGRVVPELMLAV